MFIKNGIKIEIIIDYIISGLNYLVLMGEVNRYRLKIFSKLNYLNVKRNSGLKYKYLVRLLYCLYVIKYSFVFFFICRFEFRKIVFNDM